MSDTNNPYSKAMEARRKALEPKKEPKQEGVAETEEVKFFTRNGKVIPITPASGGDKVVKTGAGLFRDPKDGTPYKLDPLAPSGLRNAWNDAPVKSKDGKLVQSLPGGVGTRELGEDPKAQEAAKLKEQKAAEKAASDADKAAKKAADDTVKGEEADLKRQQKIGRAGVGAAKRTVAETEAQFISASRTARESAALNKVDLDYDARELKRVAEQIDNATDAAELPALEARKKEIEATLPAKQARQKELAAEVHRSVLRQEVWRSQGKPAAQAVINAEKDRVDLMTNTGRRAPVPTAKDPEPAPKAGFREQPDGGGNLLLPKGFSALPDGAIPNTRPLPKLEQGMKLLPNGARALDGLAEFDAINANHAAKAGQITIKNVGPGSSIGLDPFATPLPKRENLKPWETDAAVIKQKTAREVGKADFHLPEGFTKTAASTGWMDAGARGDSSEAVLYNGQAVGRVRRDETGLPTLVMQRGAVSPSLASNNPYDGVPEYAEVHPDFAARLKGSSVKADTSTDEDVQAEWDSRRWPLDQVQGLTDRWRGANEAERAGIIAEIDPELAKATEQWLADPTKEMPRLDLRALYQSGQISAQEARNMQRVFYGEMAEGNDFSAAWRGFLKGDSEEAKAIRAEDKASGNVRKYAGGIDAAASKFIGDYYQRHSKAVDFDPKAFSAFADTVAKDTKGYYTRIMDTLDSAAQSGVGSSVGALYGVAIRAPATIIAGAIEAAGGASLDDGTPGKGAFTWDEVDLIAAQTGESAKGTWNFLRDRATVDSLNPTEGIKLAAALATHLLGGEVKDGGVLWNGTEGKKLKASVGDLLDKAAGDTLTEADTDRLAGEIQATALKITGQDPDQAAFYDIRNPESPAGQALNAYRATRDPVYKDALAKALTSTPRSNHVEQAASAYASAHGAISEDGTFGRLQTGFRGGQTAPMQETAVEVASAGVSGVAAKALMAGRKGGKAALEAGKAMTWANRAALKAEQIGDWFKDVGVKPGQTMRNTAIQGLKTGAVSFVSEGMEGVATSMTTGGTVGDVIDGFVQEGLGAVGMAPVMATGAAALDVLAKARATQKDNAAVRGFVASWNQQNPTDPMTADDWKQARAYLLPDSKELTTAAAGALERIAAGKVAFSEITAGEATPERMTLLQKVVADGQQAVQDLATVAQVQQMRVTEAKGIMQEVNGINDPTLRQFADAAVKSVRGLPLTEDEQAALERPVLGVPPGPVAPPMPPLDVKGQPVKGAPTPQMAGIPMAKRQKDGSYILTDAGLSELGRAIPRTRALVLPADERSQIVASQAAASQPAAATPISPGPGVSNAVTPMSAGSPQSGSNGAKVTGSNSSVAASGGNVVTGQPSSQGVGQPMSDPKQTGAPQKFSVSVRITYPSGNVKEQPFDITAESPEAARAKVEGMPTWQALKKQGARIEVASGQPLEQDKANEPAASSTQQTNAPDGSGPGSQSQGEGAAGTAAGPEAGRGSPQEGVAPSEAEFNQQAEAARQQVKPLAELLRGIAVGFGYKVVDTGLPFGFTDRYGTFHSFGTQILDKAVAGSDIGQWIDKVTNSPVSDMIRENMTKPGLHRVWFGHDPLANLATIIEKFGVTALPEYAIQLLKDMTTKSGIPLPGVQWLVHKGLVGDSAATQWLSLNVGEALGAGLGIIGTYRLYKKARDGKPIHAGWAMLGIAFKMVGGVMSANPFLLLTGLADTAILVAAKSGMMKQGMQKLREQEKANGKSDGQGGSNGADGSQPVDGSPTGGAAAQQKPGTASARAVPQGQAAAPGPGGGVGNSKPGAGGSGSVSAAAQPDGAQPGAENAVQSRKIGEALTYLQIVPQNQATIALARLPKARRAKAAEMLARLDKGLEEFGGMFTGGVRFVKGQGTFKAKRLDDGTTALTVNIVGFLDDFQDTNSMAAVQSVMGEELIHLAAMNALADGEVTGLWHALPQNIRQTVWSGYRAAEIKAGRAPAVVPERMTYDEAWQMGHEFHRILIQKGDPAFMGLVTEAIDASPTLGQKIIDYLKKFADILKSMVDSLEDGEVKTAIQEQQERIKAVLKDIMGRRVDLQGGGKAVGTGGVESGAVTIPGAVMGSEGTAYTEGNEPIGFRYAVVEAGELTISNTEDGRINPAYPAELQPRDRTSAASEAQVNEIAGNSNLDRLSQSNSVGDGAPFVGPDGVVESGNGRAMALNRAYQRGMDSVARYRENLAARAGEFGLDPAAVSAMQKPVLVRVRTTAVDRAAFAQAANVATVAPMREVEIAKKDAGNLNPTLFDSFQPSADGDIFTASNAEFIRGFVRDVVPQTERAAMVDRNGNLTQTGLRRVRNAVFAYAYGTNPEALNTLSRLTEDIDPANRSVTNALVAAAPIFAEQNARMKAGALHDLDITADLVQAVTIYNNLRARGETVADYLAQEQIPGMGEQRGPLVDDMLQWIEDNKRSGGRMFDTLRAYATAVEQAGDPRQGALFGKGGAPTKEELWQSAKTSEVPEMALAAGLRRAGLLDVEDQRAQIDWLNDQARSGGYASVDEMAVKAGDKVITLAKQWRKDHPAMLEFPDTMGSLGIPRADMPQIKRAHRGAMTNFLNARGITLKPETVPASALKPSQADFSPGKVAQAATFDTSRRLLISSDNHVLDGHHQWLANYDGDVEVFRLDAPAQTALEALHAFPSSKTVGELNAAPKRTQTDEEFDAAFKDWKYGMDERGLPKPPRTLPEGHPLLEDTLHKKTAEIPADHALVKAGILKAGTVHRAVFREAVIKYFISQGTPLAANEQPMVYASAGGGGAGKTTVLNKLTEKGELNRKGAVQVNADDIKELIPEYEMLKQAGDGAGARVNHEESSLISKALVDRLLDPKMPRYSFVYDATLANYEKALGMFDRWKAAGYKVHLIGVTITPMQAMKRAALRAIGSVRWVPGEELAKAHQGFNAGVKRLAEAADVVSIYDNTPPEAKEVAKKDDSTKGIHVVNPSYWSIIERRKEDENADQESPAEGGTPESIRAAESAGRLAGGRAGSGESNRPAATREAQREGQGDRSRDSGEVGGEAGSGVNAGQRRIKDTGTGDLFSFGESNAPATSNQGFNLLDTLTPAEQEKKASEPALVQYELMPSGKDVQKGWAGLTPEQQMAATAPGAQQSITETGSVTVKPAEDQGESAFMRERNERIKESKKAGNHHLDAEKRYVENSRGREIYNVHDPKERGVIRTVSNRGEVIVHWSDKYSADKNLATTKTEKQGRKTVEVAESWLMPTDLNDYVFADTAKVPINNNPAVGDQAESGVASRSGASTGTTSAEASPSATGAVGDKSAQSEGSASGKMQSKAARSKALAGYLSAAFIKPGKLITWQELFERADEAFGGTQANGAYTVKDAYDALEMAFNQWLLGLPRANPADATTVRDAESAVLRIKDGLQLIPTQTKRTQETDDFQQFSTVPPLAFVANWVAGVSNRDIMLEPSSGPGGIAVFSKAAGATVIGNELSPRRAALARESGIFDEVFVEDAEQIHNILPKRIRPTVVVMNPPFSNAATRGVKGNTATATRHIEQALARLAPGGRLVAIVGEGMAADRPAFRGWWQKLGKQYTIRANIQVNGAEYVKYGTSWDNQIVVIDKVAPPDGHKPIYGRVEKVEELPALLYGIRNERPAISDSTLGELGADRPASGTRSGNVGDKPGSAGATADSGSAGANAAGTGLEGTTRADERPAGSRQSRDAVDAAPQPDAGKGVSDDGIARSGDASGTSVTVLDPGIVKAEGELTDAVYDGYVPRITFPGAHMAPTPLSESSAMAAVTPPNVAYRPTISADIYADKNREPGDQRLAAHALEAATLAGAAHEQEIEAPTWFQPEIDEWTKRYGKPPAAKYRRGFFIGDGTGAGKGRQVAAIMLDNWNKGRKRHVWISEKPGLLKDALRDMRDVTGGSLNLDKQVFPIGGAGVKATDKIDRKQGIGFTSYATLRSEEKNPAEGKEPRTRIDQIVDWVGEDFDGVIAFDEAHNMGNVVPVKGSRGNKQVSQQALAGLELQRRLPNARIVYLSATGATEVENLGYAERLGVWGPKTPFANVFNFINEVGAGGVAAMELIAQNLKAMGLYVARALSWGPVTYAPLTHELTPDQRQMYDTLADAWQVALKDMYKAMELTGIVEVDAESGETSTPGGKQKGNILGKFWGAHQRFFSQIITTVKMPTVLAEMDKQLAAGNSVVVQLVNTQAAAADRSAAKQAAQAAENGEELDLETLDLTPKEELMQMVMSAFPTTQMEQVEITDDQGNGRTITRPVKDSAGNLVENAEAVALRDALLDKLAAVRVPNGPLEILTDHFGHDKLAEITGRQRRLVWMEDKKTGEKKREWEKRSEKHTQNEIKEFQDGKRRVLVFSKKGGTGESFHADRRAKNQQKRVHILLQPGWQAAAAVQGFGRTHRNNQVVAPHYILAQTDVAGEKRFISSIARRLDQLGALTKGQRQTGSQGFFNAQDNLESEQAAEALQWFYREAMKGKLEGIAPNVLEDQMGLKMRDKDGAALAILPPIKQFLNRILSLNLDLQDVVFAAFFERLGQIVESQREAGTLDVGMETLTALHTKETGRENVYLDESNGSRADLVTLELTQPTKFQSWDVMSTTGEKFQALPYVKNKRTGKVRVMTGRTQGVNEDGVNYDRIRVSGPTGSQWVETSKFWGLWDRVEGSLDESRAAAKQSWQEQREAAGETHTQTEHLLVGTMLPIWNKIPGFPRVLRAQTDDGIRMIGRSIPPGRINEMLQNLGKAGKVISPDAAIAALDEGEKVKLSNKWILSTRKVSGEERIELTGPGQGDHTTLDAAGVFKERIQWNMRYFLPKDRAAEVLEKLLDQTTATITDAGSGKSLNATNKRALPVESQLNLEYVTADGKDASSAQESRARTNPLDAGRDVRTSDTERLPSTPEAMLPWARSNGWLIDNASLFPHLGNEVRGGDEHDVWGDESTQRAIKLTLDTHFVQGSPSAYLENLQQQNELFNTGYAFEGVADDNGMARFVVSQPWVIGNSAEQKAKDAYFQSLGFEAAADDLYYSMGRDLLVSDAKPANVLQRADGTVQPIDVQIRAVNPRQAERYENMVAARQAGLSAPVRLPGQMPTGKTVNGTAQFVKAQEEAVKSQLSQEEQEKANKLGHKIKAAGTAGIKREASEAWANMVSGNIDRLDFYAPGFRDIWLDSERKLGLARAAVNGIMEKLHARAKAGFGYPAWWKNPMVYKRWKNFQAELLPVAARLEVEAINPDGSFAWKPFDMRAGDIDLRKVQALGKKAGDVIMVNGAPLVIGRLYEEQAHSFTSSGVVVKKHLLLRPMSAAAQQQVYDSFLDEWAGFPVAGELLTEFIMPGMAQAREVGPRGIRTAAFNRYSLLDFFNEWPPELQQLFGPSPMKAIPQIEGYTPDLFTLRGLSFMIAGLAKAFKSGARQVKSGAARESGNVQNLMEGFSTRLMEAHREKISLERRARVINAAAKPMNQVPDDQKHKWLPLNDAFNKLYELAVVAKGLDRARYPKITGALSPDQEAFMRQLVGEAWALRGRNLAVPEAIYRDMVGELAVRDAENLLLKAVEWLVDRFNAASLASTGFVAMNWLGNEIMKTSYMAAQAFKAGSMLAVGDTIKSRLAFDTMAHMVKGMVVDRFPLRQQRIRDVVPRELFDNDQAIKAMKGLSESVLENIKSVNVGGAILAAMKSGNWDVGAKVQLAYAAYRAHMKAAWRAAGRPGNAEVWMKHWLENDAPDTLHREVQLAAGLFLMDYQNVPRWMDASSLKPVVSDPDHPARGVMLNQILRLGVKTVIPFIRWQYSFAKSAKRQGWDEGLKQLVTGKDKSARAEAVGNVAALGMMVILPALVSALGEGDDDDKDKIAGELIGRVQDLEGGKLPQTLSAKNRFNVSALARILATRLGMSGHSFDVTDEAGDENDLWMRYRNYPYIKEGVVLGLAVTGQREAFGESWTSLFQEYAALGIAWQLAETMFGARDQYGTPESQIGGMAFDVATSPVLPHRMLRDAGNLIDPTDRRLTPSKSLDYQPGFTEGVMSRLPGLKDNLPVAGNIKQPAKISARTTASPAEVAETAKAFGIDPTKLTRDKAVKRDTFADLVKLRKLGATTADVKVSTNDKGQQVAAYPDPDTVRKKSRFYELVRSTTAANLLPVKREAYKAAVLGKDKAE